MSACHSLLTCVAGPEQFTNVVLNTSLMSAPAPAALNENLLDRVRPLPWSSLQCPCACSLMAAVAAKGRV